MSHVSGGLRFWNCPKCGRTFMIPDWSEDPRGCPRCDGEGPPPETPSLAKKLWNIAASIAAFAADGCRTIDKADYEARLRICDTCDQRIENKCLKCGCYLPLKVRARAMKCPLEKWPAAKTVEQLP